MSVSPEDWTLYREDLDTRVLTPKEAAEKARETIGAEEEFFDLAHEFYSLKMKPEDPRAWNTGKKT